MKYKISNDEAKNTIAINKIDPDFATIIGEKNNEFYGMIVWDNDNEAYWFMRNTLDGDYGFCDFKTLIEDLNKDGIEVFYINHDDQPLN